MMCFLYSGGPESIFVKTLSIMENEKKMDLEKRITAVLEVQRCMIYESVEDVMTETFCEMAEMMLVQERVDGAPVKFPKKIAGIPVDVLKDIQLHAAHDDVPEWIAMGADGKRAKLLMAFLDVNRLSQEDFKSKFPMAYAKWTAEEDSTLMKMWGDGQPWQTISSVMGRNVNALKLRLEKLGVELGNDAGRPRRR